LTSWCGNHQHVPKNYFFSPPPPLQIFFQKNGDTCFWSNRRRLIVVPSNGPTTSVLLFRATVVRWRSSDCGSINCNILSCIVSLGMTLPEDQTYAITLLTSHASYYAERRGTPPAVQMVEIKDSRSLARCFALSSLIKYKLSHKSSPPEPSKRRLHNKNLELLRHYSARKGGPPSCVYSPSKLHERSQQMRMQCHALPFGIIIPPRSMILLSISSLKHSDGIEFQLSEYHRSNRFLLYLLLLERMHGG